MSARQAAAAPAKKQVANKNAEAAAPKRKSSDPLASPEDKAGKKASAKGASAAGKKAKGGKAAGKQAGFGDLRNMFGKK